MTEPRIISLDSHWRSRQELRRSTRDLRLTRIVLGCTLAAGVLLFLAWRFQ